MANIVDDLNIFAGDENTSVVYFFVRHGLAMSSKARTIIGSIVQQILRSANALANTTEASQESLNVEDMISLIRHVITSNHRIYLILDGLDLCDQPARREIIGFLRTLQGELWVFLCASYRQEPNVELDATFDSLHYVRAVPLPPNRLDTETFIETELAHRLESRTLLLGNLTLVLDIQDALLAGSEGMFLWVSLQIDSICTLQTDEEIRDALAHLPHELSQIYSQIVQRQQGPSTKYQKCIFEHILAAQRPLTTDELWEALSVTPGDTTWSVAKLINDIYSTLAICGCLVIIDEEELTVRFVHPTVQQFLFERYVDSRGHDISLDSSHRAMADTIVTYLSYGVFETNVSTLRVSQLEVGSAPAQIINSTTTSSRAGIQNLALKLLKLRKRPSFDIGKTIAEELNANRRPEIHEFHFRQYAEHYCVEHVTKAHPLSTHIKRLYPAVLGKLCSSESTQDKMNRGRASSHSLSMENATRNNDMELMALILPTYSSYARFRTNIEWELGRAICEGFEDMTKLLVKNITFQHNWGTRPDPLLYKNICLLSYKGDAGFFRAFFNPSPGPFDQSYNHLRHICRSGRSPLACAVWGNNIPMVKAFLEDARVDVDAGISKMTPMWDAVRNGNIEAVKLLFAHDKLKLNNGEVYNLLALAKEKGNDEMIALLEDELNVTLTPWEWPTTIKDITVLDRSIMKARP